MPLFQKPLDITACGLLEHFAGWPSLFKRFIVLFWVEIGVIESLVEVLEPRGTLH